MQVQDFRALQVFDVAQHPCEVLHVVAVDGAEVADVHPFEDVLLLGGHRFQAVAEAYERLTPFFVQDAELEQYPRGLEP